MQEKKNATGEQENKLGPEERRRRAAKKGRKKGKKKKTKKKKEPHNQGPRRAKHHTITHDQTATFSGKPWSQNASADRPSAPATQL